MCGDFTEAGTGLGLSTDLGGCSSVAGLEVGETAKGGVRERGLEGG